MRPLAAQREQYSAHCRWFGLQPYCQTSPGGVFAIEYPRQHMSVDAGASKVSQAHQHLVGSDHVLRQAGSQHLFPKGHSRTCGAGVTSRPDVTIAQESVSLLKIARDLLSSETTGSSLPHPWTPCVPS